MGIYGADERFREWEVGAEDFEGEEPLCGGEDAMDQIAQGHIFLFAHVEHGIRARSIVARITVRPLQDVVSIRVTYRDVSR